MTEKNKKQIETKLREYITMYDMTDFTLIRKKKNKILNLVENYKKIPSYDKKLVKFVEEMMVLF